MMIPKDLKIYNSLSKQKEIFSPITPPFVGMYLCGPTVYGDAHLGHARSAMTFDVVFRYLQHLGYKVRYVRNITDVGHLVNDADEGEDKIAKKARLEQLEPMEVSQYYTNGYHRDMQALNNLPPSIEPRASGHIIEQIRITQEILDNGFAYVSQGSVYFDVLRYHQVKPYGILSGRIVEDMMAGTRDLDGQDEKKNPVDFALWKKASPEHILRWPSPWSEGFPGWHVECSAMSTKYLGTHFDIHGGGMDLLFPHHECEIAQSEASAAGCSPAKYWMHNNMITVNGQKMGKSLGNSIDLRQFFSGDHPSLEKAYSPMTIRFFVLQSHYRSTLDFSNEALQAASKGLNKVINGLRVAKGLVYVEEEGFAPDPKLAAEIEKGISDVYEGMNDDFNTAKTLAALFGLLKRINAVFTGSTKPGSIGKEHFELMNGTYIKITEEVLGLKEELPAKPTAMFDNMIVLYKEAKESKDYSKVDEIRVFFKNSGLAIRDMKQGAVWAYEE